MESVIFNCCLPLLILGNSKLVGSGGGNAKYRLATRLCPEEFDWSVLIHLLLITKYFTEHYDQIGVHLLFLQDCFLLLWKWSLLSDTSKVDLLARFLTATFA